MMTLLPKSASLAVILSMLCVAGTFSSNTILADDVSSKANAEPVLRLDLIPDDAMAGVVVRPNGFFTDPELKVVEGVLNTAPFRFPISIVEIDQIALVAEQRPEGLLKNKSTLIFDLNLFEFRRPFSLEQMLGDGNIKSDRKVRNGTPYESLEDSYDINLWRMDDRRALIAPSDTMERAIDRGPIQPADSKTRLQKSLPSVGGSQLIMFVRGDVLSERLKPFFKTQGATGIMSRTMGGLADGADHIIIAIERSNEGSVRVRFAVACPDESLAIKKKRSLGALLVMFKQFMAQRKSQREANIDSLGDRRILANDAEKLFDQTSIDTHGSVALINLQADIAVGNVLGLFSNVFGSVLGRNFVSVSVGFDEATVAAAQPKAAVPSGVMSASLEGKQRSASIRRMTTWAKALNKYREKHGSLPATELKSSDGRAILSWRVAILPELGQQDLFDKFHLDEPWDSPHNRSLVDQLPEELRSPYPAALLSEEGKWDERIKPEIGRAVWLIESKSEQPWTSPGDSKFSELSQAALLMAGPPGQAFLVPTRVSPDSEKK